MPPAIDKCNVLVVGGGMAAIRLADNLSARQETWPVVIAGDEAVIGYNRVLLPDYVAGACTFAEMQHNDGKPSSPGVSLQNTTRVESIDLSRRHASTNQGLIQFEKLVFATGSNAPVPDLPGAHLNGVVPLRCLADADTLRNLTEDARTAVVLGGGLLGLETADALLRCGLDVHIVHRGNALMNKQLDQQAGALLRSHLASRGMQVTLQASITAIEGDDTGCVRAVRLDNGERIATDILILATGTAPETSLAVEAGVSCENGIKVDRQLRTSATDVFALGECANVNGERAGLVALVNQQADVLAENLAGGNARLARPISSTHLKLDHLALFSAGETRPEEATDDLVLSDERNGIYRRLLFTGTTLIGAILYGNTAGANEISKQINATLEPDARETLAFGY